MDGQGLARLGIQEGAYFNLKIRVEFHSRANAEAMASEIKNRLAKEEITVAATFFQDPDEHWAGSMLDGVIMVMEILAVVSLFMSVVLVTNTVTAIITEQTNQIGIIKAIGGRRWTIIRLYIGGVLVYGTLALAISLPLGASIAYGGSRWFLYLFNIDHDIFQLSQRAVLYQALAALVVPVLAALWPVLYGAAITVRAAIARYGLGSGHYGGRWLDRWVERVGQSYLAPTHALAAGNMFRRIGRLLLTQFVLVAAGAMFIVVMTLSKSLLMTVENDMDRRDYDLRLIFVWDQRVPRTLHIADSVPGVEQATMWYSHSAAVLRAGQRTRDAGSASQLVGVPVENAMYRPIILSGRWLQPGDGNTVVISKELAEDNHIAVGEIITLDLDTLGSDEWKVAGVYQFVFRKVGEPDPLYAPLSAVYRSTKKHQSGTQLLVRTASSDPDSVQRIKEDLQSLYEARRMKLSVFGTATTEEDKQFAVSQFRVVTSMLLLLALVVAVVGGLGLMGSLSISVVERTREIGVMRAIGARSSTIIGMFVIEGVAQGVGSWLFAVPFAFFIAQPISRQMGQVMLNMDLDYYYNVSAAAIWFGAVGLLAILASIWPARRATRISVRQSLAYA
jgi:putative ABC transport system permease protein